MRNDGLIVSWLIVCLLEGMCCEKRVRYDHRGCACKAELIPKLIIRFERCLGSLVCVEKTRTRHETLSWSIPCKTIVVNIDFFFLERPGDDRPTGFLYPLLRAAVAGLLNGMLHPQRRS